MKIIRKEFNIFAFLFVLLLVMVVMKFHSPWRYESTSFFTHHRHFPVDLHENLHSLFFFFLFTGKFIQIYCQIYFLHLAFVCCCCYLCESTISIRNKHFPHDKHFSIDNLWIFFFSFCIIVCSMWLIVFNIHSILTHRKFLYIAFGILNIVWFLFILIFFSILFIKQNSWKIKIFNWISTKQ